MNDNEIPNWEKRDDGGWVWVCDECSRKLETKSLGNLAAKPCACGSGKPADNLASRTDAAAAYRAAGRSPTDYILPKWKAYCDSTTDVLACDVCSSGLEIKTIGALIVLPCACGNGKAADRLTNLQALKTSYLKSRNYTNE